jgi:hypothetical protein
MGVEVAGPEAAAVEEDQQRPGLPGTGRHVQAGREPGHLERAHRADALLADGVRRGAAQDLAALRDGQLLGARQPAHPLHPQHQLEVGGQRVPVEGDRAPRQGALGARRQRHRAGQGRALHPGPHAHGDQT